MGSVVGVRLVGVRVLVALLAVVALGVRDQGPSGPPMLTDRMLHTAYRHGAALEPDPAGTRAHAADARRIAAAFGPNASNPERRVVGLSFGTIGPHPAWVVYSVHVLTHCFGMSCGPASANGREIDLVSPSTLRFVRSSVF